MKLKHKLTRRGFTLVELLVVMAIIATLASIATPVVLKQRKKAHRTQAVSNAKQIAIALFDFDEEFLSYPNDLTATRSLPSVGLPEGAANDANDCFNQLVVSNKTNKSEAIFFVRGASTFQPDDDIMGGKSLEAGENGFGYVKGLSSGSPVGSYIIMTPLAAGSTDTFNVNTFDGEAILLKNDQSVTVERVNEQSGKIIKNGENVFSANHPGWGTDGSNADSFGLGDVSNDEFDSLSSNFHNLTLLGIK